MCGTLYPLGAVLIHETAAVAEPTQQDAEIINSLFLY